jgi:hypothetical protein
VSSGTTVGKSIASGFSSLTSYTSFLGSMGNADGNVLTPSGTATVDGQTAAVYTSSKEHATLYFAASGPAYLLEMVGHSTTNASGTVTFTWNQPTTVTAPPASEIYSGS